MAFDWLYAYSINGAQKPGDDVSDGQTNDDDDDDEDDDAVT
jgi:hypothetical protein